MPFRRTGRIEYKSALLRPSDELGNDMMQFEGAFFRCRTQHMLENMHIYNRVAAIISTPTAVVHQVCTHIREKDTICHHARIHHHYRHQCHGASSLSAIPILNTHTHTHSVVGMHFAHRTGKRYAMDGE